MTPKKSVKPLLNHNKNGLILCNYSCWQPNQIKQFWFYRLYRRETTENYKSMEETNHHVLHFVYGTRNLWRQGQCLIREVGDQEHLKKTSSV